MIYLGANPNELWKFQAPNEQPEPKVMFPQIIEPADVPESLTYLILYSIYGIIFYVSSIFIVHNDLEIIDALSAVFLISFTGTVAGSNLKLVPNLVNIRVSAISIFKILDCVDEEQKHSNEENLIKAESIQGKVEF